LDIVDMFSTTKLPAGPGVGIVTQSGGAGVLIADRAEELGLSVPELSDPTQTALRDVMPAFGAAGNPVDITAQFLAEPTLLSESVRILLEDPAIDIAIVWLQLMDGFSDRLLEIFRDIKATVTKPFVVVWVAASDKSLEGMRALGICTLRGAEPAVDAVAAMVRYAAARTRIGAAGSADTLRLPDLPGASGPVPSLQAAALLEAAGVPLVESMLATDPDSLRDAAEEFGYPLALKIESPDILHKTEVKGVALALKDWAETTQAFDRLMKDAGAYKPDARLDGAVVQRMAGGTVELVVGAKRDTVFGPTVMVGIGGVFIEVMRDVAFRIAPVSEDEALAMLAELKGAAVLDGARGAAPVDKRAVARLVAAVSRFAAASGDRLVELDLNPVRAGPDGALAVDWLMVLD
ncbi:MAG: acetate--CoA ligase family protein, partial [Alphaproteobacteria bacterium]|nr:acetate--CoA ligase family protein [Alphaproteobacteria bacterium]